MQPQFNAGCSTGRDLHVISSCSDTSLRSFQLSLTDTIIDDNNMTPPTASLQLIDTIYQTTNFASYSIDTNINARWNRTFYHPNWVVCVEKILLDRL
jgi:hypothetical protein